MVLMLLDHTRDFFHIHAFDFSPTDPNKTTLALFTTRWITHLCAPAFAWLTGYSIAIQMERKSIQDIAVFLFTRGLFLITLEFTLIKLAWHFDYSFDSFGLLVLWALGVSMLACIPFLWLPKSISGLIGLFTLITSAFFYNISSSSIFWHILMVPGKVFLNDTLQLNILYPIVPMWGVVLLGYGMYDFSITWLKQEKSTPWLWASLISLLLFLLLRFSNNWGDPHSWNVESTTLKTIFSFLNVTKYPMSLHYITATFTILFLLLFCISVTNKKRWKLFYTIGRVPLFFYILHLFLAHATAVVIGQPLAHLYGLPIRSTGGLPFDLPMVYIFTIFLLLLIVPLCKVYYNYKKNNPTFFTSLL